MFEELRSAVATLEGVARDLEPRTLEGHTAVSLLDLAVRGEHLCASIKGLLAQRVDETGAHRASGARSAGHWLALRTGVPVASAFRVLETVEALGELPVASEAFRAGHLSEAQAHEITGAARKDPSAEAELVSAAKRGTTHKGLKDRCQRVRAGAEADDAAWAQRLRDGRELRTWVDTDTSTRGIWRMAPDKGSETNAALDAETDLLFREARARGESEPRERYAADALHALITRGPRKATSATLVMDQAAEVRGYARRGERCEIPGIGQIPVTIGRLMLADAKVREIPRDGALLPEYSSDKRYYPAWMVAWLDQKYPVCGQPGCDADFHLQTDHVIALEDGGLTELDNLWRLCWHHHRLKHDRGWKITGEAHAWQLVPPDDRGPP